MLIIHFIPLLNPCLRSETLRQAGSLLKGRGLTPFPLQGKGTGGWGEVMNHIFHDLIKIKSSFIV